MDGTTQSQLRICTFKGLQALPLYAAREQGFFAMQGLDIKIIETTGSLPQLTGLAHGAYDLIQTAPDNVINIDSNPAAFGLEPATAPHILMLFGGSTGPLSLYAQPSVATFEDLRGTVLGVDNPTSGFALVLRDMLARHGLALERDYTFVVAGGTSARLEALKNEAIAATILYAPFDLIAAENSFPRLASSTDYYAAYASLATAGTQTWVESHGDMIIRYITALRQALRWIYNPACGASVREMLSQELSLGVPVSLAPRAYSAFVDPLTGFSVEGMLDEAGTKQVIDLREAYSAPPRPLGIPADYQDLRWYHLADDRFKQS
jgi:ABC-type nitrate/sulfonate/bicarbonate transport system substrate-binding protein